MMAEPERQEQRRLFVKVVGDVNLPVRFYLHPRLTDGQRKVLQEKIERYGGIIWIVEETCHVLIVPPELYLFFVKKYSHSRSVYVEEPDFIQRCIGQGKYEHAKQQRKALGGRPPKSARNAYTARDDERLAKYLAIRIPDDAAGGRQGNKVYQELVDDLYAYRYPWARNHTWQSWRTRYKNNMERLNERIAEYVKLFPPQPDGKGQYHFDRRAVGEGRHRYPRHEVVNQRHVDYGRESEEDQEQEERERAETEQEQGGPHPVAINRSSRINQEVRREDEDGTPEQARRENTYDSMQLDMRNSGDGILDGVGDFDLPERPYEPGITHIEQRIRPMSQEMDVEEEPLPTQATFVALDQADRVTKATQPDPAAPSPQPSPIRSRSARNRARTQALKAKSAKAGPSSSQPRPGTANGPPDTQATLISSQTQSQVLRPNTFDGVEITSVVRRGKHSNRDRKAASDGENDGDSIVVASQISPSQKSSTTAARRGKPARRTTRNTCAKQALASTALQAEAPYRNLRSRSISVQPQEPLASKRVRKGKAVMTVVPESEGEADNGPVADVIISNQPEEVYADQQSLDAVENVLRGDEDLERAEMNADPDADEREETHDRDGSNASGTMNFKTTKIEEEKEEEEEEEEEEDSDFDMDDDTDFTEDEAARTLREGYAADLRRGSLTGPAVHPIRAAHAKSAYVRKRSGRYPLTSIPPVLHRPLEVSKSTDTQHLVSNSFNARPKRVRAKASNDETSESDFPTPGTRARQEKERIASEQKKRPFTPALGTKAFVVATSSKGKQRA